MVGKRGENPREPLWGELKEAEYAVGGDMRWWGGACVRQAMIAGRFVSAMYRFPCLGSKVRP